MPITGIHSEDVAIFWDYENCHATSQLTGYEIVKKIRLVAHNFGNIKLFKAYLELSDPATFSKSLGLRSELQSSGVSLTDCPHNGRKDVADKMILVDMLAHAIDNPAPSTIILISGDRDFAYAVSILRLRRYRVVVVSLPGIHTSLKAQASIFLDWNDVLGAKGVDECSPLIFQHESVAPCHKQGRHVRKKMLSDSCFGVDDTENDITDHLSYSGKGRQQAPNSSQHVMSERGDEPFKDIPSRETYSCIDQGSTAFRSPSRTESAPAALGTEIMSPTSTIVNKSPNPTNKTTNTSANVSQNNAISKEPAVTISMMGLKHAQRPLSVTTPTVTFPVPDSNLSSVKSPQPTNNALSSPLQPEHLSRTTFSTLPIPTSPSVTQTLSALPKVNSSAVRPSVIKVVPPVFKLLVERLEHHRLKGFPRLFRSGVAIELASKDNTLYRRAGVEKFGQYVAMAEKAGIVELGGKEGGAWIGLCPEWYGAQSA